MSSDAFNEFDEMFIDFLHDNEVVAYRYELVGQPEFFFREFDQLTGSITVGSYWCKLSDCSDSFKRDFYDIFERLNR